MEKISDNITHTNDENRDQSSNQNIPCDICARTFRTNRRLLQHFNFRRQRNRHQGDNPSGDIQANNNNHDLNNNEVDEINDATNPRQNNQNENQENFYLNVIVGTQFANEPNNA